VNERIFGKKGNVDRAKGTLIGELFNFNGIQWAETKFLNAGADERGQVIYDLPYKV